MVDFTRLSGKISRLFGSSAIAAYRPPSGPDVPLAGAIIERRPVVIFEGLEGMPSSDAIDDATVELHLPSTSQLLNKQDTIILTDLNPAGDVLTVTRGPYATQDGFYRYGLTEFAA